MSHKMIVQDVIDLDDGKHKGTIVSLENVTRGSAKYEYTDVVIRPNGKKWEIKAGFPTRMSKQTALGKLWERLTEKTLIEGEEVDLEEIIGIPIEFTVYHKTEDGKKFLEVLHETIERVV